jgi:hypothetical protein
MGVSISTGNTRWVARRGLPVLSAISAALCLAHAAPALDGSIAGLDTGYLSLAGASAGNSHAMLSTRAALAHRAWELGATAELHNWTAGQWTGAGRLESNYRWPLAAGLSVDLGAVALTRSRTADQRTGRWEATSRLALGAAEHGAWIDAGGGRSWDGDRWLGFSRAGVGGARAMGPAVFTLSVSLTRFADQVAASGEGNWILGMDSTWVYVPGEAARHTMRTYADARLGARWGMGAVEVDGVAGLRWGQRSAGAPDWARLRGTWWVGSRWALVAEAGRNPAIPEEGLPAESVGYLGLRVDLFGTRTAHGTSGAQPVAGDAPAAFAVHRIRGDLRRIQLVLPGVERVELAGDFNEWQPLALDQTAPGIWQTRLMLRPGAYRVSIRTAASDWTAPPGLPSQPDEFGRSAGLLIVR